MIPTHECGHPASEHGSIGCLASANFTMDPDADEFCPCTWPREAVEAMELGQGGGAPVARLTDPETSHEAAASVLNLTERRQAVLDTFRNNGGRLDDAQVARYYDGPAQSPSGLRTRRAELVRMGFLRDSGERVELATGRKAIVWEVTEQ